MNPNHTDAGRKINIAVNILNTLFIVITLFLHVGLYTSYYPEFVQKYNINLFLQKLSVGGFLFISGYKLTMSKATDSLKNFVINRFFRVYLLYLLCLIFFSFTVYPDMNGGHLPSYQNFILHALCLQSILPNFFGNNYLTIWFVSVLFYCYFFFFLTRKIAEKTFLFFLIVLLNIFCIFLLHNIGKNNGIDIFQSDLHIYLIFFALGMSYFHHQKKIDSFPYRYYLCLFCIAFIWLMVLYNMPFINTWYLSFSKFFFIIISSIPLYFIIFKIAADVEFSALILKMSASISYSSFCIFLFHRVIWSVMAVAWYEKSLYQFLYIVFLGSSVIFLFSYCMQKTYDKLIDYRKRSKSLLQT